MEAHAVWSLRLALFAYDDDEDGKAMSEMAEMGPFWRAGLWALTFHFDWQVIVQVQKQLCDKRLPNTSGF